MFFLFGGMILLGLVGCVGVFFFFLTEGFYMFFFFFFLGFGVYFWVIFKMGFWSGFVMFCFG